MNGFENRPGEQANGWRGDDRTLVDVIKAL